MTWRSGVKRSRIKLISSAGGACLLLRPAVNDIAGALSPKRGT